MSSDHHPWIIQAQGLSKTYRLYDRPHHRLLQSLAGERRRYYREFSALNNVSFELQRGETLGIIGTNGAGKSTLLQLLCGTLQPSDGHVQVQGRIAALLELGAGFNPEFTGRENLTINAAILGLTPRQIEERTEDIIAFADIGDFIDRPVKTYSSGMYVRLAFSVVVHVDPQILIVDEALAVGDALFQFKCMSRMRRMLDDGVSLLFTSHDISAIKALCQRTLWLEKGQTRMLGATPEVTRAYDQDWVLRANEAQGQSATSGDPELPTAATPGTRAVEIIAAHWGTDGLLGTQARAHYGDTLQLRVRARVHQNASQLVLSYHIKNKQNQNVIGGHTACEPDLYARQWQTGETFDVAFNIPVQWHAGDYALTLLVASIGDVQHYSDAIFHDWQDQLATLSVVPRQQFPLSDMTEPPSDVSVTAQAPWFIVDDFFPHLLTGFRVAEYNAHLHTFGQLQIMSTLGDFSEQYGPYRALYPEQARRVSSYVPERLAGAALAYITFLNNAHAYLDDLTRHRVPFVLNLYPGGGLGLGDAQSDQKLLRVLASPLLKDIIVTQPVVERYLTQLAHAHGLSLPPLHMVQGVVVNPDYFDPALTCHGPRYGQGKDTLDICFVAESYMPGAANKGFPEFMAAMQRLADLPQLRIHVVGGGYTPADLQMPSLDRPVQYHGRLPTGQLREFYGQMDLIVSPNRPGQLHAGNFDGFPTGACVEAALCEVAIMATDALQQNPGYVDQQSIFLLDHDGEPLPEQIERTIRHLAAHPEQLSQLANSCQRLTRTLYAPERQIATRQDILRKAAS
jgi:lipopolysaccharide transport system ATP-binding protein